MESNCFADEIAIDFPSAGHFVARVRRAFLAGDADGRTRGTPGGDPEGPITRQLCLSSKEAERGTTVPLEVLLRETCERCGGRGEIWTEPCADCGGAGDAVVPRWVSVPVPPHVTDGTRLHFRISAPREAAVRVQVHVAITT